MAAGHGRKKRKAAEVHSSTRQNDGDGDEDEVEQPPAAKTAKKQAAASDVASAWKGFCSAFASIMARAIEKSDAPVLAETEIEQKLQQRKAEFKERRLSALENKAEKDKGHVLPDITQKNFEMHLRKMATQGVVRLFNAVRDYQAHSADDAAEKFELQKLPLNKRGKVIAESKKAKFEQSLNKAKQGRERKAKRQGKSAAGSAGAADGHDALDEFA
eukprot:TRINITY_DN63034_c0_g1_i1.p1 TRINITY_DN63034_c0_g1~~TRINITY_DN63034_c0_g1_i1.p1  ORF type:complete len:216 (-),score=69.59 TRINITY_DN63034_c0_g1_i1:65-712(-)